MSLRKFRETNKIAASKGQDPPYSRFSENYNQKGNASEREFTKRRLERTSWTYFHLFINFVKIKWIASAETNFRIFHTTHLTHLQVAIILIKVVLLRFKTQIYMGRKFVTYWLLDIFILVRKIMMKFGLSPTYKYRHVFVNLWMFCVFYNRINLLIPVQLPYNKHILT